MAINKEFKSLKFLLFIYFILREISFSTLHKVILPKNKKKSLYMVNRKEDKYIVYGQWKRRLTLPKKKIKKRKGD